MMASKMPASASAQPGILSQGELLAGKYRIERLLGSGGMGTVYAAHHELLYQRVAIKLLKGDIVDSPEAVTRFLNEARAAARIQGEHVARVMDVGQLPEGIPYMVLEYLDGFDLAQVLQKESRLPITQAVDYVLQALEALAQAHAVGIIHRDLKPANLFLARLPGGSQCVKVLDFGISKVTSSLLSPEGAITATESILGTPSYMSPEQLRSTKSVDGRTDVWALGIILYELLTGATPFRGDTIGERLVAIIEQPIAAIRSIRPDVPPGLDETILRCLARDPRQRLQNVAELAIRLAPFGPDSSRDRAERVCSTLAAAGVAVDRPLPSERANAFTQPLDSRPAAPGGGTGTAWKRDLENSGARESARKRLFAIGGAAVLVALFGGVWRLALHPGAKPGGTQTTPVNAAPNATLAPVTPAFGGDPLPPTSNNGTALIATAPSMVSEPALAPTTTSSPARAVPQRTDAGARARDPKREPLRAGPPSVAPASSVEYSPARDSRL
jgi:serine/threonine-protein kinase